MFKLSIITWQSYKTQMLRFYSNANISIMLVYLDHLPLLNSAKLISVKFKFRTKKLHKLQLLIEMCNFKHNEQ